MPLTTLWVDMDAYFASAEQCLRPALRGRPVGVVPTFTSDGRPVATSCCIAVSYEARPSGVKTGVVVREAQRRCPGICLVHARPAQYVRLHHRILAAAQTVLPVDKVYSIDEFACRLLGVERDPARAAALGVAIKDALRQHLGDALTCSIGIASNRLLAKVAADRRKPDGLNVIEPSMAPECFFDMPLDDWPGINRGMTARFGRAGVTTTEQMYALTETEMSRVFGSVDGRRWWMLIRGVDIADKKTQRRTLGHEHVLAPDKRSRESARRVLVRLLTKVAQRLRREGLRAGEMACSAKLLPEGRWVRRSLLPPTSSTRVFLATLDRQWRSAPDATFLLVAVTLRRITPAAFAPGPLFEGERADERLDRAVDAINSRFGYAAIRPASADIISAPMRISFSTVPDLDIPDLHA